MSFLRNFAVGRFRLRFVPARLSFWSLSIMKPTSAHSFPNAEILGWKLSDNLFEIEMSNVIFDGQSCGKAKLVFPLVRPATAMSYDFKSKKWLAEAKVEQLKDIREFHHKCEKIYSIKGYGADTGKFFAVAILSREAEIVWEK
jgi:hypothetical protein